MTTVTVYFDNGTTRQFPAHPMDAPELQRMLDNMIFPADLLFTIMIEDEVTRLSDPDIDEMRAFFVCLVRDKATGDIVVDAHLREWIEEIYGVNLSPLYETQENVFECGFNIDYNYKELAGQIISQNLPFKWDGKVINDLYKPVR